MEHESKLCRVIRALINEQRKLAASTSLTVRFRTIWSAARLDNELEQCTDAEISQLLIIVQEQFHIFGPEFAICEHAKRRLLLPKTPREELYR